MASATRIFRFVLLGSGISAAQAEWQLNLPAGVTSTSQQIFGLHMLIFWICVVIALLVFGAVALILLRYRRARGAQPGGIHEHTWVEVAWTVVPFLVLALMAIPATRVLMEMEDTTDPDLTIQVTGSQWKWRYEYIDQGIGYFSNLATPPEQRDDRAAKGEHYLLEVDRPLVVPVGRKVRFLLTSSDVIHAWWIPPLGLKKDAVPGFINEAWTRIDTPGIYRGQCAELCGVGHGYMPIVIDARSEADFAAWLTAEHAALAAERGAAARTLPLRELMTRGKEVYTANCAACHQAGGEGLPGTFPPLKGSAVATGPVAAHLAVVLHGRPGTAMPSFAQLSDLDLAAVVTYERNAWGNATGDTVQAADVTRAREE